MKFSKVVSIVSAFAIAATMFSALTVANAASLGGKPFVSATFDSYEKVSDTVAFAYVNIAIDMTEAETLVPYSLELDEVTWEEVTKGNGITTMGVAWTSPEGFTYTKAKSVIPSNITVGSSGEALAFGPTTNAENYIVDAVTTIKLAFRVNDFDQVGDFTITNATVDGKNSEESEVWSYSLLGGTIDVESCTIPSYNDWANPSSEPTITDITIDPTEVTLDGEGTQVFTVEVTGEGDYDSTYTLSATAGSFDGNTYTAPAATEEDQVITITATANGDESKTATATVTVRAKEVVTEPATKIPYGSEGKAIFLDSEQKTFTFGTSDHIKITSAADGASKLFGKTYFENLQIEGDVGASVTAQFGVIAADTYADGNFSFEVVNK